MNRKDIEERIIRVITEKKLVKQDSEIALETSLKNFVNSIKYIQLIVALEQEFNIEFDDELEIADFSNLNDIIDVIYEHVA